jgi:hypothetical protein
MIFNKFNDSDVVLGRTNKVSSGFWVDGDFAHTQSALYTSSTQVQLTGSNGPTDIKNGLYYFDVYNADPAVNAAAQVHFSIAYGNYDGDGTGDDNTTTLANPTKVIYSQYKNCLLNPSDSLFSFKTGSYNSVTFSDSTFVTSSTSIFVIAFSTTKFKDRVDEGQLEFSINGDTELSTFIDDSSVVKTQQDVYNIISGSIINGVSTPYKNGNEVEYKAVGLFYPKTGTVILNATTVDLSVDLGTTGVYKVNQRLLFNALTSTSNTMKVRKSEFLPSRQYFVRIKNQDFNYSNNPTFVSDGTDGLVKGTIKINEFLTDPKTYPTTVGLYDDANELIAVAKLSRPVQKSFNNEILLRIKIDF